MVLIGMVFQIFSLSANTIFTPGTEAAKHDETSSVEYFLGLNVSKLRAWPFHRTTWDNYQA